jgi:hypothetical protein
MSKDYDNTNSGFIGKNSRKVEEKHPDLSGNVNSHCEHCGADTEFWLSGWKNSKGYGLRLKPKDAKPQSKPQRAASAPPPQNDNFDDDEIPF